MNLYRGLILASGSRQYNPCILAMLAESRAEALRLSGSSSQESCRLIKGLILTEQWSSAAQSKEASEVEKVQGRELLRQLAEEDPGNGFFSLMALGSLYRGGESQMRTREGLYLGFLRGERFVNPLHVLSAELYKLGHQNSTALLYSIELTSTVGTPYFTSAYKAVNEFSREARFPAEFSDWVARLGARFEENERLSLSEPVVNLLEDAILKGIAVSGTPPQSVLPPLIKHDGWIKYFKHRALAKDLAGFIDFNEPCESVLKGIRIVHPDLVREDDRQFSLR